MPVINDSHDKVNNNKGIKHKLDCHTIEIVNSVVMHMLMVELEDRNYFSKVCIKIIYRKKKIMEAEMSRRIKHKSILKENNQAWRY